MPIGQDVFSDIDDDDLDEHVRDILENTGEGYLQFFLPFKREGYEKNDRKRGRVTRN